MPTMAPKGTTCEYGGTGPQKRPGCKLPQKKAAKAAGVEAVLEAVHAATCEVLGADHAAVASWIRDQLAQGGQLRKTGSGYVCNSCRTHLLRVVWERCAPAIWSWRERR